MPLQLFAIIVMFWTINYRCNFEGTLLIKRSFLFFFWSENASIFLQKFNAFVTFIYRQREPIIPSLLLIKKIDPILGIGLKIQCILYIHLSTLGSTVKIDSFNALFTHYIFVIFSRSENSRYSFKNPTFIFIYRHFVRQWESIIPSFDASFAYYIFVIFSRSSSIMPRYSFKNLYLFIDALFDNENRLFFPPARSLFVYSSYFFDQRIDIKNTRLFIDTLSENELFLPSFL